MKRKINQILLYIIYICKQNTLYTYVNKNNNIPKSLYKTEDI